MFTEKTKFLIRGWHNKVMSRIHFSKNDSALTEASQYETAVQLRRTRFLDTVSTLDALNSQTLGCIYSEALPKVGNTLSLKTFFLLSRKCYLWKRKI